MWLYAVRPNRNETKRNAVAKSHLKMHNKNLFIGLGPLASPHCILVSTRLVSSRLDLTLLASRGSMLCKPGSLFVFIYIFLLLFFFYSCFTAHIIRSTYYTKTQITQQIFTDAVNRNRFNFPSNHRGHATTVSFGRHMPVSFGRRLCGFVLLVWLHCIPKMRVVPTGPDNRYKSAKQPHPTNQESSRHGKMSPDQIKII